MAAPSILRPYSLQAIPGILFLLLHLINHRNRGIRSALPTCRSLLTQVGQSILILVFKSFLMRNFPPSVQTCLYKHIFSSFVGSFISPTVPLPQKHCGPLCRPASAFSSAHPAEELWQYHGQDSCGEKGTASPVSVLAKNIGHECQQDFRSRCKLVGSSGDKSE